MVVFINVKSMQRVDRVGEWVVILERRFMEDFYGKVIFGLKEVRGYFREKYFWVGGSVGVKILRLQ